MINWSRTMSLAALFSVGLAALPSGPVEAGPILFNTFGAGDTFDGSATYGVDGSATFQAFRFVATATGALEDITVALGRNGAGQGTTTFNVYADAGGVAPGGLLESFAVPNTVAPDNVLPFTGVAVTFASVAHPVLTSGVAYWLSFTEPEVANGASSFWFFNSVGVAGPRFTDVLGLVPGGSTLPAFRVEAVPEPGALGLVVVGLVAASVRAKGRVRMFSPPAPRVLPGPPA